MPHFQRRKRRISLAVSDDDSIKGIFRLSIKGVGILIPHTILFFIVLRMHRITAYTQDSTKYQEKAYTAKSLTCKYSRLALWLFSLSYFLFTALFSLVLRLPAAAVCFRDGLFLRNASLDINRRLSLFLRL